MSDTIYCEHCGAPNAADAKTCVSCGKDPLPEEHLLLDFLKEHTKSALKDKAEDTVYNVIKNWLLSHLYGLLVTVTVISSTVAAVVSNSANPRIVHFPETPARESSVSGNTGLRTEGLYSGEVIHSDAGDLYWKYDSRNIADTGALGNFMKTGEYENSYVLNKNGTEQILFTAYGFGDTALLRNRIYYSELINGINILSCIETDGSYSRQFGEGLIQGTDSTGRYLYYSPSGSYGIGVIDTDTDRQSVISRDIRYLTCRRDTVYAQRTEGNILTLYAMNTDGSGLRELCTVEGNQYITTAMMHFNNDTVYFSCGSIEGTGGFYQGGRVIRVNNDGSGMQVLAGESVPAGADFTVLSDGTVAAHTRDQEEDVLFFQPMRSWKRTNSGVYWINAETGEEELILSNEEYASGSLTAAFETVRRNGSLVYFRIHYMEEDSSGDLGWRQGYRRVRSVLMMKDLKSKTIRILNEY